MEKAFRRKTRTPEWWKDLFRKHAGEACRKLDGETLKPFGLKTEVVWDHPYTKKNPGWCAAYLRTENRLKDGIVAFTFNTGRIYAQSLLTGRGRDRDNVRTQAYALSAHETAHGLMDHIRSMGIKSPGRHTTEVLSTRRFSKEEESLADEYGRFFAGLTGKSVLNEAILEITGRTWKSGHPQKRGVERE